LESYTAKLNSSKLEADARLGPATRSCPPIAGHIDFASLAVGDIVGSPYSHRPDFTKSAEKPPRATVLAEPFSGTVTQGVVLVFAREMNELSPGQKQRPA